MIASLIELMPTWMKTVVFYPVFVWIMLYFIQLILKKMQCPEIKSAMGLIKKIGTTLSQRVARSLELPVKRSKFMIVIFFGDSVLYYLVTIIFFAHFGLFLILSTHLEHIILIKRLAGLGVAVLFLLATRWCYVHAEYQRLMTVKHWKILLNKDNSSKDIED